MKRRIGDILKDKIIGISVSESDDIEQLGFGNAHLVDCQIEIARYLLSGGMTLMYGGDLRKGGFTRILFDLVQSYSANESERRYLISYLGWPLDNELSEDLEATLSDKIEFIRPGLPPNININKNLDRHKFKFPMFPEEYAVWAYSMTHMRKQMTEKNDARIFLGGRRDAYRGKYPGLVEEVFQSMEAGKPTYLIGLFGGATRDVVFALEGGEPLALTDGYQLSKPKMKKRIIFYNKNKPLEETEIDYDVLLNFFHKKGIKGLNNGLSIDENKRLFTTQYLPEIISLIMKGLVNRFKHSH